MCTFIRIQPVVWVVVSIWWLHLEKTSCKNKRVRHSLKIKSESRTMEWINSIKCGSVPVLRQEDAPHALHCGWNNTLCFHCLSSLHVSFFRNAVAPCFGPAAAQQKQEDLMALSDFINRHDVICCCQLGFNWWVQCEWPPAHSYYHPNRTGNITISFWIMKAEEADVWEV